LPIRLFLQSKFKNSFNSCSPYPKTPSTKNQENCLKNRFFAQKSNFGRNIEFFTWGTKREKSIFHPPNRLIFSTRGFSDMGNTNSKEFLNVDCMKGSNQQIFSKILNFLMFHLIVSISLTLNQSNCSCCSQKNSIFTNYI